MPIKQDGRKNNGGHKNAGRKPIKNPKRTGSMRLSDDDWAWLDDPANGKSRGEIVNRLIAEHRRIAPWVNEVKKTQDSPVGKREPRITPMENEIGCVLHISATARAWQSPTRCIALRF